MPEQETTSAYQHAPAWLGGVVLAGLAVVTVGLCGTIAVLVRDDPDPATEPVGNGSLAALQWLGLAVLVVAGLGYALSHAASQQPERLPAWTRRLVLRTESALSRVPLVGLFRGRLPTTKEISRFVAVVGPFTFSLVAAVGIWLATDLGLRSLLLGGAFAGAAAAGAAILVEPLDTSIQSAGMFLALLFGSFAAFGWSGAAALTLGFGSLWIVLVADVTDAVVQRRTAWVAFTVVGVVAASTAVLAELDNTLASLTVSGRQPRSFADLAPVLQPQHATARVQEVAATWLEFRRSVDPYATVSPPGDFLIRSIYALVDSAGFAVAYSLLLIALVDVLLGRLATGDPRTATQRDRLRSILVVTKFSVPVLFMLDVSENVSGAAAVLPHSAARTVHGAGLDGVGGLASLLAVLHWMSTTAKWITVAGAVVAVVATAITLVVDRCRTAGTRTPLPNALWLVRGHLVLVVVLALALRNRQTFDAIRRLARGDQLAGTEVIALVITVVGCACAVRYLAEVVGREAARVGPDVPTEPLPPMQPGRSRIDHFLALTDADDQRANSRLWHGVLATSLAVVMALFLGAPGGLIPVLIWAVLEVLSMPLRPRRPDNQQIGAEHRARVWRRRILVAVLIVVSVVGSAWLCHALGDAAAVRWMLIAIGTVIAGHALGRLIPPARLRSSWVGLRPAARAWLGARPVAFGLVPACWRTVVGCGRWLLHSILRRLLLPLIWALGYVRSTAAERLSVMLMGHGPAIATDLCQQSWVSRP